jgi:hypothetical protein
MSESLKKREVTIKEGINLIGVEIERIIDRIAKEKTLTPKAFLLLLAEVDKLVEVNELFAIKLDKLIRDYV